jgi:hypothetical protein
MSSKCGIFIKSILPEGSAEVSRLPNGTPISKPEALHFDYNPMPGLEGTVYNFNFLYRTRSMMVHARVVFFAKDHRNTSEYSLHTTQPVAIARSSAGS